jgi:hypothetical protein
MKSGAVGCDFSGAPRLGLRDVDVKDDRQSAAALRLNIVVRDVMTKMAMN